MNEKNKKYLEKELTKIGEKVYEIMEDMKLNLLFAYDDVNMAANGTINYVIIP